MLLSDPIEPNKKSVDGDDRIIEMMSMPSEESVDVDIARFFDAEWCGLVKMEPAGDMSGKRNGDWLLLLANETTCEMMFSDTVPP